MRLVHGQQRDARLLCKGQKGRHIQPLRGHVDDAVRPSRRAPDGLGLLAGVRLPLMYAAATPDALSAMTWSFISEISGEITSVIPLQHQSTRAAGSTRTCPRPWASRPARRLAEQLIHQLLLPFREALVAEHALEYLPACPPAPSPLF